MVAGVFDLHVHAAPDIVDRRADDLATARAYAAAGFTGFVLKAHYESTVGRAHAAASAGIPCYGGIALNQHAGGLNPAAVAAALAAGGRVVWLPTADSHTQHAAGLPRLCHVEPGAGRHTYALPPVDRSTEPAVRAILDLVAAADAVLATGHVSGAEAAWVVSAARAAGVTRILLTHPGYTVPDLPAAAARELAEAGALVEVTAFQLLHQPGCTARRLAAYVRDVGYRHLVLSSDAGQPDSPSPPDALAQLIDELAAAGLDRSALVAAAAETPERLVTR
jgi:uncharacterized protein DUF6282